MTYKEAMRPFQHLNEYTTILQRGENTLLTKIFFVLFFSNIIIVGEW